MNVTDLISPACALFLDFDGTLVDIAPQPDAVHVPSHLVEVLESLSVQLGGALAVVSGRPISQIDHYLSPLKLPCAGVHGAQLRHPGGTMATMPTPSLQAVQRAAQALALQHPQLVVEDKGASLALHFRQAPELAALCLQTMAGAVAQSPGLNLLQGKMVVEAKPAGASKGGAIESFLHEAPFAGRTPVFIGDDVTDEAGFAVVQSLGGHGIKVGDGATVAWHRLATPAAMRELLQHAASACRTGATA